MLEQLTQVAQQHVPQALANIPGVPADQQQAVAQEASQSVFSGMQQLLQQGGPGALKGLFQGAQAGDAHNPQVQQLTNRFAGDLSQKMGISGGIAKTIGAALIPVILSQVFRRAKDPSDSGFNIKDILGSLLGGGAAGGMLGGVLGGMLGGNTQAQAAPARKGGLGGMLDRDGDGDTDLADLMAMFR